MPEQHLGRIGQTALIDSEGDRAEHRPSPLLGRGPAPDRRQPSGGGTVGVELHSRTHDWRREWVFAEQFEHRPGKHDRHRSSGRRARERAVRGIAETHHPPALQNCRQPRDHQQPCGRRYGNPAGPGGVQGQHAEQDSQTRPPRDQHRHRDQQRVQADPTSACGPRN